MNLHSITFALLAKINDKVRRIASTSTGGVLVLAVAHERLELGSAGDGHVERFGREERLDVEQVEVVLVDEVGEQLVAQAVQRAHLRQRQVPPPVRRPAHVSMQKQYEYTVQYEYGIESDRVHYRLQY